MIAADPLIILIASGVLVAVFARAAWHKLADFGMFKGVFAGYAIVPPRFVAPLALVLTLAEIAIVAGFAIPAARQPAALGAMVLLFGYGLGIAVNLKRGRYLIDCGCGGSGQGLSWFLVARNVILAAVAALAILAPADRALTAADAAVLAMSVTVVWLLILAGEQAGANDAHRQFLRNSRNRA